MSDTEQHYLIACADCKQTTHGLTAAEADRETCPKCDGHSIIIDAED